VTQDLAVTVDPVAPSLTAPSSVSVSVDGSVSLPITVTPFDPSDNVQVAIAGLPADAVLADGDGDTFAGGGTYLLTAAQVDSGLTLDAGGATTADVTVTATNEAGPVSSFWVSTSQSFGLTVGTTPEYTFTTLDYPGAIGSSATGINNAGVIVGQSATDSEHTTGWELIDGVYSAIGVAGSQDNAASGINNDGVITGFNSPVRSTPRYGFIDDGGVYSQINVSPPGISTTANGINDSGVIVGASYLYGGTEYSAFIDNNGSFTFINAPGTDTSNGYTVADSINNAGEIVGTYNTSYFSGGGWQGFIYQNGSFTTLDDPLGSGGTFADDVNNEGQVVGWYIDSNGVDNGFIYSNGIFTTIDDPLAGTASGQGTQAYGINDLGEIVGDYTDSSGVQHGFSAVDPVTIATGGIFQINGPSADVVTFAGSTGSLQLAQSQGFAGTIAGFGGSDQIDLGDIGFGANTTLGYTANNTNTGGTLTASDGIHTANITLLGQYTAASFATASDGHGGTTISEPAVVAQNQLTQPHG
jgi:probable HAF family extracellular repeat protein